MEASHSQKVLLEVLRVIAEQHGCSNFEIKFANSASVLGYTSKISQAQIISKDKEMNFVIKNCSADDKIRTLIGIQKAFKREIYMYDTIFPLFRQFEIDHGKEPLKFAPKFYKGYSNELDGDAVILKNLKKSGYSVPDDKTLLNEEHMKYVMERYAHFHACSFAYKNKHLSHFETLTQPMYDIFRLFIKGSGFTELYIKQMKKAGASLDPKLHKDIKGVYERFISETESFLMEVYSIVDEYSVIVHGDCWTHNLLYKYGNKDKPSTPTDVRMIDFQVSKAASPMVDISNLFYACGTKEVIDHYQDYLDFYHDALSKHLHDFGCDVEKLYPHRIMMEHWKKFARYGLIVRTTTLLILFGEGNERKCISDTLEVSGKLSDLFDYTITNPAEYEDLSRHIITHFVENRLI